MDSSLRTNRFALMAADKWVAAADDGFMLFALTGILGFLAPVLILIALGGIGYGIAKLKARHGIAKLKARRRALRDQSSEPSGELPQRRDTTAREAADRAARAVASAAAFLHGVPSWSRARRLGNRDARAHQVVRRPSRRRRRRTTRAKGLRLRIPRAERSGQDHADPGPARPDQSRRRHDVAARPPRPCRARARPRPGGRDRRRARVPRPPDRAGEPEDPGLCAGEERPTSTSTPPWSGAG